MVSMTMSEGRNATADTERQRHQAIEDAHDHCRRAAAALRAAHEHARTPDDAGRLAGLHATAADLLREIERARG